MMNSGSYCQLSKEAARHRSQCTDITPDDRITLLVPMKRALHLVKNDSSHAEQTWSGISSSYVTKLLNKVAKTASYSTLAKPWATHNSLEHRFLHEIRGTHLSEQRTDPHVSVT